MGLNNKTKMEKVVNDLYLFYRVFVGSKFNDNLHAPHIKTLSRELMRMYNDEYHRLCVAMPPRHKLANSTPVLTTNGWKNHGDLKIGDYVYGLDGKPTEIIGVSGESLCDKLVTFSNGSQILAHSGHLWNVYKRNNKSIKTIATEDIEKDYYCIEKNGKKRYKYHLPLIKEISYDEKELPIDPYWFGLWLGDGSSTKPCITHSKEDSQFIEEVPYIVSTQCEHKITGVLTTYFSNQDLVSKLKELGVYDNKHIPKIYLESSFEQRIQLLAGLIDSDGNVDKHGRVRFVNVNKELINTYYELCVGLGLYPYQMKPLSPEKANSYKRNSDYNIVAKQTSYCVGFQPRYTIPTKIPRKKIVKKGVRRRIGITNIETVNGELGKCIEIANDDGVYLVGKELIPTHNSKSSMITLAYPLWLIFRNPNLNILIINNSGSLSEKFGIQLREYVKEYGEYFNVHLSDVKKSQSYLMFSDHDGKMYNGSIRLIGKGGAITGTDADVIIIDDPYKGNADDLTPSALEKTIDWYNTIVEQRIEPQTRICILHTRWNSYDLQGYLKENDKESYKFIEFPAILEDNTPLWGERYTIQELEKKRERMGHRMFESIYQQKPLDDTSDYFDISKIKWFDPQKEVVSTVRAWDIASADEELDKGGDYSSGARMRLYSDGTVLVDDIVYGKFGNHIKEIILNTAIKDTMDCHIVIETGVGGAAKLLYKSWADQLKPYIVEQAVPVTSKVDRATPLQNAVTDGLVYMDIKKEDTLKNLKKELNGFPNYNRDDIIDSLAHAYNYLCSNPNQSIIPDLMFIDL